MKLFLKWFFRVRGSVGVHPTFYLKPICKLFGMDPSLLIATVDIKSGERLKECTCTQCGQTYWSYKDKPYPTCLRWQCFKEYNER